MFPVLSVAIPVVRLKLAGTAKALISCSALADLAEMKVAAIPITAKALTQLLHSTFIFLVPFPLGISSSDLAAREMSRYTNDS
jgi:hypothetical protein